MQPVSRSRRRWCGGALVAAGLRWAGWPSPAHAQGAPLRWTPAAEREAVALLIDAASHGLAPEDYRAAELAAGFDRVQAGGATAEQVDNFETALTRSFARFLAHLHRGRIDPRTVAQNYEPLPGEPFDAARALADALAAAGGSSGGPATAVRAAVPQLEQYQRLREALARYRGLQSDPAWQQALPALPGSKLESGSRWAGVPLLAARLRALGDLVASLPADTADTIYGDALAEAVRAFQRRHALAADGAIGRATLAALNVPPAQRARQIELALERLRWIGLRRGPRMILVNLPEFVLRAYEVEGGPEDGRIRLREEMRVVVGRAMHNRTPVFEGRLGAIEFAPYWNVPASIARAELVPQLRRSPGTLAAQGYEFVDGSGRVQTQWSAAALDAVLAGRMRIRQRPGPRNALGDIKFIFPNSDAIYLHHTPSVGLFDRERRDFSHGCIRVEHPLELARFVLHDMPEWTDERIRAAMAAGRSSTLRVASPVPVVIAYGTALVRSDGAVQFFDDIYGHDRTLDQALRKLGR